ncbi:MAG: hypothetical protein OK452_06845 [Thaumarchaeota archaeon]|nr:hypothetical protein [Nitrososphaerota archaeon]
MNIAIMAMATAKDFFGKAGTDFASNVQKYHEYFRKNDLIPTYTLINPQVNKRSGAFEVGLTHSWPSYRRSGKSDHRAR